LSGRWDGVPALVTGAQGFVGSWLAERLLAEGARVIAPRRRAASESRFRADGIAERCELVDVDIADVESVGRLLRERGVRAVFHLASQSIEEVARRSTYLTWEANVRATWTVLEACREAGEGMERIVVASSARAYEPGRGRPYREDDPLGHRHPYAVSKAAADLIARSYAGTHGLPVAVARLANVYGGGDLAFSRLVPDACRALVAGGRPVLRSDGTPERELIYIEDAVEAYLSIAASLDEPALRGRAWNAGSGEAPAVIEVVRRLIAISGRDVEPDVRGEPRAGGDREEVDSTAIRTELGWSPAWDLDRGLAATYDWYRGRLAG
jgi:CDP-glucose 4,6-dehydratase